MREKWLTTLASWHTKYPFRMLLVVVVLSVLLGVMAAQLKQTMRWSDMLPANDPRTLEYNRIVEEFVSATSIVIVVQGEETEIKAFADSLAPRLLKLTAETAENEGSEGKPGKNLIKRVDYKAETAYLRKYGLLLTKADDLKDLMEIYQDPNLPDLLENINDGMEKEYVGDSESISTREREDGAVMFLEALKQFVRLMQSAAGGQVTEEDVFSAADNLLYGEPYFLSYDRETLILNAIPNFTIMDLDLCIYGTDIIQDQLNALVEDFPGVRAGLTGFVPLARDEMVYSEKSLGYTTLIAIAGILILLILSLRMWVAPVFAIVNLIIGILWAVGVAAITVGQLNIMTSMMAVILMGLGIDFSIHLISGFTERRALGESIEDAMRITFRSSGKGIVTGGLTTAFAFLTLIISASRGMNEMGLVTGLGLIAILIATFLTLPVMLVLRERIRERAALRKQRPLPPGRDIAFRFLGNTAATLGGKRAWPFTLIGGVILTGLLLWGGLNVTFDHNYMNIEPKGLRSIALQDTVLEAFDLSMDYAMILAANPAESRGLAESYRDKGSVAMAEDISMYLPSPEQQQERMVYIRRIGAVMRRAQVKTALTERDRIRIREEIDRLRMNVLEMQDMAYLGGQDKVDRVCRTIVGDPLDPSANDMIAALSASIASAPESRRGLDRLQQLFAPYYRDRVMAMTESGPVSLGELPEQVLDRFSNEERSAWLVTVFPAGNMWQDAEFLDRFIEDLEEVSDRATGLPPVFKALIEIIGRDGRNALILTVLVVFLLLWFDFRNPKYAFFAMLPLLAGICWMAGLMYVTRMQFTVMNVMGLPLIVGIGIDDGVHVMHRWIAEGRANLRTVFASTGKAILLTSLTTMLAFGSLAFSVWRGFAQLGSALFLGVGACFLTTVIFLAALLGWLSIRSKNRT